MFDHAEIMGDEQIGQAELVLQIQQQIDDLRLHRHIECGHRLIGDNQAGIERERAGNADALALSAAEGMGKTVHIFDGQLHDIEQFAHPLAPLGGVRHAVDQQRLADQIADHHARVERGEGILKHHLQMAAERFQPFAAQRCQIGCLAVEREVDLARTGVERAHDAARHGGFAAAAFAHQRQGLSAFHREADIVDRLHMADHLAQQAFADREIFLESLDLQQSHDASP